MSLSEVRSLSYEEYQTWRMYFMLEPFGWGALNALLYNANRGDEDAVTQDELAERRVKAIQEAEIQLMGSSEDLDDPARIRAIREAIKRDFGAK